MGSLYTATSVSSYNSNPPSDDGTVSPANQVTWATQKSKLADPIKTAYDTSETNTASAFAKTFGAAGITSVSTTYTVATSDQGKLVKVTGSGGVTITTPDATSVNSPFTFGFVNDSSAAVTLAGNNPGVQQTVDGSNSISVPAGNGLICATDGTNWFTYGQNFTKSFPPPSAFKNLSIKVATNTTVTLAADYITVTDGSKYQTLAFSTTINMATTGAAALDTGSIASATWYAIWAIAKADGTTSAIASTSSSSPTMPSGYTYKARVGWVRTASGSAQLLGTWQLGRRAQYVVGLAQTTLLPQIGTGTAGNPTTGPTWVALSWANYAPSTAGLLRLGALATPSAGTISAAPNNNYGIPNGTNPPPLVNGGDASTEPQVIPCDMIPESSSIYWANSNAAYVLFVFGWEDNI